MAQGFRHVRVQVGVPGMAGYGVAAAAARRSRRCTTSRCSSRRRYIRRALKLFEECRKQLGDEVELLHDMHERVHAQPGRAVRQGRWSSSSCSSWKTRSRRKTSPTSARSAQQCATPIAMGELFNSPHEWTPLISERLIDYIRIHVSQAGGFTPCRKIAAMGETVRRARRPGTGRATFRPIGHAANVDAGPGLLQLRHPGVLAVQRPHCRRSSTAARR